MQADSINHTKHHYELELSILSTFSHQTKLLKYPGTDSKHFSLSIFNNPQVFNHTTHYDQSTTQAYYQEGFKIAYTRNQVGSLNLQGDWPWLLLNLRVWIVTHLLLLQFMATFLFLQLKDSSFLQVF